MQKRTSRALTVVEADAVYEVSAAPYTIDDNYTNIKAAAGSELSKPRASMLRKPFRCS